MDKSREQFECEMSKLGDCVDMRRAKNGDQEYMAWDVGLAWKMWQASRTTVEIQLESEWDINCDGSRHYDADSVDEKLSSFGLKVRK